jgi:predicted GNAT family N-acyltransferase
MANTSLPMHETTAFTIRLAHWSKDQQLLRQVREQVFVQEQLVPMELEWDGLDDQALHLLALDARQRPIGVARLLPSGQIGRMAVLKPWRRRGVGSALLQRLLSEATKAAFPELFLHAQLTALPFYTRLGFRPVGEVFEEAGIPHRRMNRSPDDG